EYIKNQAEKYKTDGNDDRRRPRSLLTSQCCQLNFHSQRPNTISDASNDFVSPPNGDDGVVQFLLYDLAKPQVPSCSKQFDHVNDGVYDLHGGFTLALLDILFSKGLRTVKSIPPPPKCRLGFSRVLKEMLDNVICKPDDVSCWVSLLVLSLCLPKTFHPRSNLECSSFRGSCSLRGQACTTSLHSARSSLVVFFSPQQVKQLFGLLKEHPWS
ncbi:hypothetical protein Tco_1299442, partial [Tanacetum coccineum]